MQLHKTKTAFITGIAGQDGAYLAAFLLDKGYHVHGLIRWDSTLCPQDGLARLDALGLVDEGITLHMGDLCDAQNITRLIAEIKPDEIYNLGAMSHVQVSFQTPASTFDINTKGTLHILEAVRLLGMAGNVKIYQASSSEMFGSSAPPQNEDTKFEPCSPYGVAKLASYWLCKTYRDSYGIFVANGILFNHESPLRGEDFVTQKIVQNVVEIEQGRAEPLMLGNLDALRDWGHAKDYVRGMWMMLQHESADDFVLATGQAHSVRSFVEKAFTFTGREIVWQGHGVNEVGHDKRTGQILVRIDAQFFRPKEVDYLLGDAGKARRVLGWRPENGLDALVADMMNAARGLRKEATKQEQIWLRQVG